MLRVKLIKLNKAPFIAQGMPIEGEEQTNDFIVVDKANVPKFHESGVCMKKIVDGKLVPTAQEEIDAYVLSQKPFKDEFNLKVIDTDTVKEIAKGFDFDGKKFSLSLNAQMNWQGLFIMKQAGLYSTQEISTIDNKSYELTVDDVDAFFQAGSQALIDRLKVGRDKKQ